METPFVFGRIALGDEFTNRDNEVHQLINNFSSGINTILISPRRWGKSSLVSKAALNAAKKNKKIRFCFIDLYDVRNEEQFYQLLAQEIIKISASKWEERIENVKNFMARFIPKITYSPSPENEFALGLDWKEVKKHPDQIINLAENISKEKNIKIIICIDEFQNIAEFENPVAFQKKLRSHWQKHQKTSYCLYGSKRHMMMDVFTSSSMPFYKFGDILFLEKIAEPHWKKFIVQRFIDTGKKISPDNAIEIARAAELHPYYVQQLAQQCWLHSNKTCTNAVVMQALDNLLLQLSLLFQNITDSLTTPQVNFLKAVLNNEEHLSSKETLREYNLGTSANILRIKQALINKEIIDIEAKQVSFLDPMYKHWLQKYYFKL